MCTVVQKAKVNTSRKSFLFRYEEARHFLNELIDWALTARALFFYHFRYFFGFRRPSWERAPGVRGGGGGGRGAERQIRSRPFCAGIRLELRLSDMCTDMCTGMWCRHPCRHVYRHVYSHVYRHVCRHAYRHVYGHV